ncbi:Apolipoprotein N-acyltransferase [Thalassoglobus neptunius]|uniref:Apolipoprotein N-acyltransferase n=1 Tax=Thalassoglobus neptunius TaxID=1938619 RepID=A0A5C5X5X1_9PLAN|nr:apolipoprotein N-acyltransferase [Thalassoglobus neptunius]TWT58416.1 Apolipoprotein N-acyltransferase [Thalassoglobus neptunius]
MDDMPATGSEPSLNAADAARIQKIVERPQKKQVSGRRVVLRAAFATAAMLWAAFTPLDWGWLAWISLVPLLSIARIPDRLGWTYRLLYLSGFLYWLITLQWMRYGDPSMYIALAAMAFYLAFYWPIFVWLTRTSFHRFRIPLFVSAPILWTGLEYLRSFLFTGFSWYYLGHTQHNWVDLIQISDLVGAYGISFLIVMSNAVITECLPLRWIWRGLGIKSHTPTDESQASDAKSSTHLRAEDRPLLQRLGMVALSVGLVIGAMIYGQLRRGSEAFPVGPRVSLVQGNFVASLKSDRDQWGEIFQVHYHLTGLSVRFQPDLIIWPEGMFRYPVYETQKGLSDEQLDEILAEEFPEIGLTSDYWNSGDSQQRLSSMADMTDAGLIVGASAFEAGDDGVDIYNSAVFAAPQSGVQGRYHKIHRVPFGEYIPLREQLPLIQSLTPFRGDFGIQAGTNLEVFTYKDWRLLPIICFEDTVPQLVRQLVSQAQHRDSLPIDVLVNLTNDGWFHGSSELDQHLITAKFRTVETRTPMVRAVNTGISAVIDGDGVVREPNDFVDLDAKREERPPTESMKDPETGRYHRQRNLALIADVPLDPRESFYVRFGDWFAASCLVAVFATFFLSFIIRPADVSSE